MKLGTWVIAGSPIGEPYPCRCNERMGKQCSAAWCPCAGRTDPPNARCCANWFTPADHMEAMKAWRIKKLQG